MVLGTLLAGCVARRTAPPPPVAPALERADLADTSLLLRDFMVTGLSYGDGRRDLIRLKESLLEYLLAGTDFETFLSLSFGSADAGHGDVPAVAHGAKVLYADVLLEIDHTTYRTYILDALNVWPLGIFGGPFVPWWGQVDVVMTMTLSRPGEAPLWRFKRTVSKEFSAFFYTWWRRAYVEDTYADAYGEAFARASEAVAEDAAFLAGGTSRRVALVPMRVGEPTSAPNPNPMALITEKPPPSFEGPTGLVLTNLGGVEGSYIYGFARVGSRVRDEGGRRVEVAAGKASQRGYRVALYSAPTHTGFFAYPTVGYLSQSIDIADFRRYLPEAQVEGGTEIDAVCSDPTDGSPIDCAAPNVYRLKMESTYGGLRAGANLVVGNRYVEAFGSLSGGVNLVEYRTIMARVATYRSSGSRTEFLQSGAVGATLGLRFPQLHSAIRFIADYEVYRSFRYEEPLEFKGPVVFNQDKQVFERPRTFVHAAGLSSLSLQCALAVTF